MALLQILGNNKYVNINVSAKVANSPHEKGRISVRPQYIMAWGWHITEVRGNTLTSIGYQRPVISDLRYFTVVYKTQYLQ